MRVSRNKAELICRKIYKKCKVKSVREITEAGIVNPIFEVTISNPAKSLILKTYPKKWEHYKPDKESYVFKLISAKTNLPVPEIYVLDKSKKILKNSYLLMSKLEGKMPKKIKIPLKERKRLFFQLGKDLAKLHTIKFREFGWVYKDKISKYEIKYSKSYKDWKSFFFSKYKEVKEDMRRCKNVKYGNIDLQTFKDFLPRIEAYFKKYSNLLEGKFTPVLIHNDFSLTNIFIQKNKHWNISGLFDVEMSMTGHNEYELANLDLPVYSKKDFFSLTELGKEFFRGYKSAGGKISKLYPKRQKLYFLYAVLSFAIFDGFELRTSNKKLMRLYVKQIKSILKNG